MHVIFDHIYAKRKGMLKSIILLGLISLFCISAFFIVEYSSPKVLRKYFYNYIIGGETTFEEGFEVDRSGPDFYFEGSSESLDLVSSFRNIVKEASVKVYDIYSPLTIECISVLNVNLENATIGSKRTIFVTNSKLFTDLVATSDNETSGGAIHLSLDNSTILGNYYFNWSWGNTYNGSILVDNNMLIGNFEKTFPDLRELLLNYNLDLNWSRVIFIEEEFFYSSFGYKVAAETGHFPLFFGIKFMPKQQDIIYWSIDSNKKLEKFQLNIRSALNSYDNTISLGIIDNKQYIIANNSFLVNLIYSFVRSIQLIIWLLSGYLLVILLKKNLISETNREIRPLLAGASYSERILKITVESLSLSIFSSAFGTLLSLLFVWLHSIILQVPLAWTEKIVTNLYWFNGIWFLLILGTKIDFEFYLHRLIKNGFSSEDYQPFSKIPQIGKIALGLLLILPLWLLNRTLTSLGYTLAYISLGFIISLFFAYFIRLVVNSIIKGIQKHKQSKNKAQSKTFLLLRFWKKNLFRKISLYSFMILLVSSIAIYSITSANSYYQSFLLINGGEISFATDNTVSPSTVRQFIDNASVIKDSITEITDYHRPYDNYSLFKNSSLTGSLQCEFTGVDYQSYFAFFQKKDKKLWLQSGDLTKLTNKSVIISEKFAALGFSLGDSLTLTDNTIVNIQGVFQYWPGTAGKFHNTIILSSEVLQPLLSFTNSSSYRYTYRLRVDPETVQATLEYLEPHLKNISFNDLNAIDTTAFKGFNIVFLNPSIILGEIIIISSLFFVFYLNSGNKENNPLVNTYLILAMSGNPQKPYWNFKIIEIGILLMVFIAVVCFSVLGNAIFWIVLGEPAALVFRLEKIFLPVTIMLGIFLMVILLQVLFEWSYLRKTNLALQLRHPE